LLGGISLAQELHIIAILKISHNTFTFTSLRIL
jgi:hypothetical protein